MTSEQKKSGLPTWAKILIGIVVGGIVIGAIAIGGLVWFVGKTVKEASDPVAVARTAKTIADFADPLPAGFKYVLALPLAGINFVTIEHESDKQVVTIVSYPKQETSDAQQLVDRFYQAGIQSGAEKTAGGKLEDVKVRGTETVGGEPMPYLIGTLADKGGAKFEGFVGCVLPKGKTKTVIVYGMQPAGTGYNVESTKELLRSIKGF